MAQGFGFIGVLEKQAHSGLRNCFSSMPMEPKDKSDLGIIESSFLRAKSIILIVQTSTCMHVGRAMLPCSRPIVEMTSLCYSG